MKPTTLDCKWVSYRSVSYLRGRGISWGIGPSDIYPHQATDKGKYSLNVDIGPHNHVDICDLDLRVLAKDALEHVFVGNRITEVKDPASVLKDLTSKLVLGGHLALHVVDATKYEPLRTALAGLGTWRCKTHIERDGQALGIFKLAARSPGPMVLDAPRGPKGRALIARYGAIGDMIMVSPLIRALALEGYEVTVNVTPYCAEVLKHNPYISNVVLQERDAIPNSELGQYWAEWAGDYEKYINLSESIEGGLLKVEGRRDFYTSKAWREAQYGSVNYFDQTMKLGGYPDTPEPRGELYFNRAEEKAATWVRERHRDKFLMLWALKGSSYHKHYPLLKPVLGDWLDQHPDAFCLLAGGPGDVSLQFEHPQVLGTAGAIPIREVFALTKVVDLVGGPESAITNAAGCFSTPKVTLLSHSTHDNLCKYWENDYCITPVSPCYPCHQLHYTLESCPVVELVNIETKASTGLQPVCCTTGILGSALQDRLSQVYASWKLARA